MNNTQYIKFIHITLYIRDSFLLFGRISSLPTIKVIIKRAGKIIINVDSDTFDITINVMQDSQIET